MTPSRALLLALIQPQKRAKHLARALDGTDLAPAAFLTLARRFGITTLTAPYLDTWSVRLDVNGRSITEGVLAQGSFQCELFDRFAACFPDHSLAFINIGANIGTTCLNAHRAGFRDLTACEPVPSNFALLEENLRQIAATCALKLLPVALGAQAEVREIFLNPASTGRHSMVRDFGHGTTTVETRTLDAIAPDRPGLLWIDAEGFEAEILRGGEAFLARHCRGMCLEVTPALLPPDALAFLTETGARHFRSVVAFDGTSADRLTDLDPIRNGQQADVIFLP